MLQLAVSASAASHAAAAAASAHAAAVSAVRALAPVQSHVCALLLCLVEHRLSLLLPDCASLVVALTRASLHSLSDSHQPLSATRSTALALARLLSRLPAAMPGGALGSSGGVGVGVGGNQLSAALPALLHDYLHACKQCSDVERGRVWQSVLQPAVASLLHAMSEHDVTATHLLLPSAERELFRPIIAHYKRELRYRGQ